MVTRQGMIAALLLIVVPHPHSATAPAQDRAVDLLTQREARERQRFQRDMQQLAQWCKQNGLHQQATETRRWLQERPRNGMIVIALLPREVGSLRRRRDGSDLQREWGRRYRRIRENHADDLFRLAARAARAGQISFAYDMVRDIAQLDPDHANARALLGYAKFRDQWVTPFEREKFGAGWTWDDRFGWLPQGHLARYEHGMRFHQGKWISDREDSQLRRDLSNGWQVRTEHYAVLTNHSLEAGVELCRKLEDLYRAFHNVFAGFFTPKEQIARMFEGRGGTRETAPSRPFQVVYFRDRYEYTSQPLLRTLLGKNLDISAGAYVPDRRTAFFFHDPDGDGTTVLHEGTHQLFSESRGRSLLVGKEANFWIVEGVACYMESLQREGDRLRIGGFAAPRFLDARYRTLKDGYYVPLRQLTGWGIEQFQGQPDLRPLYSQTAGLAQFFMHYEGGRYREALVEYLQAVYSQQDRPETLRELTGMLYGELDKQYREFLTADK